MSLNLKKGEMADVFIKKKILLAVHIESCFQGLLNIGRMLKESGRYEPIFLFVEDFYTRSCMERDMSICKREDIYHLKSLKEYGGIIFRQTGIKRLLNGFAESLAQNIKFKITGSVVYQLLKLYKRLKYIRRLICNEEISLVVTGLDLAHYDTSVFIKAAHLEQKPAVIVTDIMTNASEFGELYYNNPRHRIKKWNSRLVGRLYPHWVLEYKKQRLMRLPSAGMVLAKELLGLAPPLPWQIHSGYADAILVESEEARDFGISNGLPPEQVVATGTVSLDIMAKILAESSALRYELYQRLNFHENNKPMILLALPQDDHPVGYARAFTTYKEMVYFFVTSVAACHEYNVVVCLHPSTKHEDVKYIEQLGVKIAQEPTANLIPLCDIYVCPYSSTIKWAIVCAKPVVVYDYNRHKRSDFIGAKGVLVTEEKKEFIAAVQGLTENHSFYEEISGMQKGYADRWGRLDGKAGARILKVFDDFIMEKTLFNSA